LSLHVPGEAAADEVWPSLPDATQEEVLSLIARLLAGWLMSEATQEVQRYE
jgi:hypothetical protein